jgi:hypothetical protein
LFDSRRKITKGGKSLQLTALNMSILSLNPGLDNIGGAPYTGSDFYGRNRAVCGTGSTLYAGITVNYLSFFPVKSKHLVGADFLTHAAANTSFHIKRKCCHSINIS